MRAACDAVVISSSQMSDSVMEAIANALRLDESERLHLLRLARPAQVAGREIGPETVRDSVVALAASNNGPAVTIIGRRTGLLGGNRLGFALFGLSPDQRPNMAKQMFLEPAELVGELSIKTTEFARISAFSGAAPGSPSAERLRLLDSLAS